MQAMSYPRPTLSRTAAAVEILVVLLLTMLAGYGASKLSVGQSPLLPNLLSHLAFVTMPVLWLILSRRPLVSFGISLDHWQGNWNAAMTAYLPVALGASLLGFLDYRSWLGGVILASA
jgi:Na+/H+-dicarboxylate symporter